MSDHDSTTPKPNSPQLLSPTRMLAPTAIPQRLLTSSTSGTPQSLNTGSATGNPRNKCALKPGYSLMGWIRLGDTEENLSGTHGRIIPVSSEELSKHNTKEDAWMAIRGRVYNVTRYIDYHPGGAEELMRGIGRDATKLFDEVHGWVNYQQLLAKCYVGPLRNTMKIDTIVESSDVGLSKPQTQRSESEIVPRCDWTQKRADITIYIYTRQHCNPGLVLLRNAEKSLEFRIQIEYVRHRLEFDLQHSVDWPPKAVSIGSESGKIEVTFRKTTAELWTLYGTHQSRKMTPSIELEEEVYDYEVMSRLNFNHDSFELSIKNLGNVVMLLPIGYHVTLSATVNGDVVKRSYTPVFSKFLHSKDLTGSTYETHLNFLIKSYAKIGGVLSRHLSELQKNATVQVSPPKGCLKLENLLKHRRIALLAAGSGLTPFLNLIEHLLKRTTNRLENLLLMYFNKTEADIWCHKVLKQLQLADERFHVINILSKADETSQNLKGRISLEMLMPLNDKNTMEYATFVAVCGPSAFNQKAEELLKVLHFDENNIHTFQG